MLFKRIVPFFFGILFLAQGCFVSVPVGGSAPEGQPEDVIIQAQEKHFRGLEKDYKRYSLTYKETLSARNDIHLFRLYPEDRDMEEIVKDLNMDARIKHAHADRPAQMR